MNKRITNICRSKWKNENEQIVSQMLKCDKCVTNLAEKIFENLNVNNK